MCQTNVYTDVHPDGHTDRRPVVDLCSKSRNGKTCDYNTEYRHPPRFLRVGEPGTTSLPPTPPRSSGTASPYLSGYESDKSPNRSSKRRSGGIYINGTKVADLNSSKSSRREKQSGERVVIVDGPPTPRSPPRTYTLPASAPSSPNSSNPFIYDAAPHRRPVLVDERPRHSQHLRPPVVITGNTHRRHRSGSSSYVYDSSASASSTADEERRRRKKTERELAAAKAALRQSRIDAANEAIRSRPAVPVPPQPPKDTRYRRPSVLVSGSTVKDPAAQDNLVDAMDALKLSSELLAAEDKKRRRRERREQEARERAEEEAQRQRLAERLMPKRRATVGPGSRRTKIVYGDGLYRWE